MPRPRYQMTDDDVTVVHRWVRAKFRENAELALSEEAAGSLEERVLGLEERQDVRGLLREHVSA